jgi:hypothetical protein
LRVDSLRERQRATLMIVTGRLNAM